MYMYKSIRSRSYITFIWTFITQTHFLISKQDLNIDFLFYFYLFDIRENCYCWYHAYDHGRSEWVSHRWYHAYDHGRSEWVSYCWCHAYDHGRSEWVSELLLFNTKWTTPPQYLEETSCNRWHDDDVLFILDQHVRVGFFHSASSLKQKSAGR